MIKKIFEDIKTYQANQSNAILPEWNVRYFKNILHFSQLMYKLNVLSVKYLTGFK